MKDLSWSLLAAACLLTGILGNLHIPKPVIVCSGIGKNCLRGQYCDVDNRCHNPSLDILFGRSSLHKRAPGDPSLDGRCGPQNGGLICAPNSAVYVGTCCSAAGWCGNTPAHCGEGCTSGCTPAPPPANPPPGGTPRPDGRCGRDYGGAPCQAGGPFGGCCSEFGYCGSSPGHCLPSNGCQSGCSATPPPDPQEPTDPPPGAGVPTQDGTCGRGSGNTVCTGWPQGECCSLYGFCGNTLGHCGDGCQSGPCLVDGDPPAPGPSPAPITGGGSFAVIGESGVPVMHAALMQNGRVMFLDKVEDYSQIRLGDGRLAFSAEYDPIMNTVVPLDYKTNGFCAGGIFLANGDLISVGGNAPLPWIDPLIGDGFNAIRYLTRSDTDASLNGQDWREPGNKLASNRWYPSLQTLGDGRIFVAAGSLNGLDPTLPANNNPTYEILSPSGVSNGENIPLDILVRNQPYYMYPFTHLLRNGQMFIFTAKSSEIYDIGTRTTVRTMPDLRGDYRTYPNSGGSVLLPLSSADGWASKVMVCGGGAYQDITSPTDASCGVISPEAATPRWEMDSMPQGRGMVEGVLLPDGTVLWVNGANRGAQGFLLAENPTQAALLYDPSKPLRQRWIQLASSSIPRLYHSVALLLLDGTVLITGSNPNEMPVLTPRPGAPYITDFRVERFTPPYLQGANAGLRPTDLVITRKTLPADGTLFDITFNVPTTARELKIALYHGGFVTHSVHMGHRMLFLERRNWNPGNRAQRITIRTPPNRNVCPPGPYVLYVVVDGIPSVGQFVQMT